MSVQGDITTMPVPDFLQWVSSARRTGVAVYQKLELVKNLIFESGLLIWVDSTDPREHLGQLALQKNLIHPTKLRELIERQKTVSKPVGALMLDAGILTEAQLRELLQEKFINSVYEIFLWESGQFCFRPEPPGTYQNDMECPVDLQHLIMEGARRFDEWTELKRTFNSDELRLLPTSKCPKSLEQPFDSVLLEHIQKEKQLGQIFLEMGVHDYHVLTLLKEWKQQGWVELYQPMQAHKPAPRSAEPPSKVNRSLDMEALKALTDKAQFAEALELLTRVENPMQAEQINSLRQDVETRYIEQLYHDMPRTSLPRLLVQPEKLVHDRDIDSKTYFILSRIDGNTDTSTLVMASPLGECPTLQILKRLADKKIVRFDERMPS